jgi:ribose transport system ATP-binding protein
LDNAHSERLVEFGGIGKSFFNVPVLQDVSFHLTRGHILGLIGENGAGKSTLMNILGGVLAADSGAIHFEGNLLIVKDPLQAAKKGITFIHQELNLFPNLSIAENLFVPRFPIRRILGVPVLDRKKMRERAERVLQSVGLNVSSDIAVEDLSPGERQLVEVAKALNAETKLLILDEPTSSLSRRETKHLFGLLDRLRSQGMSMIFISHVLSDVLELCDDICVLRDGRVVAQGAKQEFSSGKMISLMTGRKFDELFPPRETVPSREVALQIRSLTQPGVVKDASFSLHKGEVLGLFGLMGSGRTELARMIFGLDSFRDGRVRVGDTVISRPTPQKSIRRGMAFVTEDRRDEGLFMDNSVSGNIAQVALTSFASRGIIDKSRLSQAVDRVGSSVGLSAGALQQTSAKVLSGGNQQKVVLAKWFLAQPKVLILDEPTRGIDVGAKYEIYRLINQFAGEGGAVLFICSEIEELLGMCDRIMVIRSGEFCDDLSRPEFDSERILRSAFGASVQ